MVQNLRAHSILHVATIKRILCVQENIELLVYRKTKVEFIHNFMRYLLSYNNNAVTRKMKKNSLGWQKTVTLLLRGGIYNPMGTGLLNIANFQLVHDHCKGTFSVLYS